MQERYIGRTGRAEVIHRDVPCGPGPTGEARKEVPSAMHGLRESIELLGRVLCDLEDRLGPVLRPESEKGDGGPVACEGPGCPVAREIVAYTTDLRIKGVILADLIRRLEI